MFWLLGSPTPDDFIKKDPMEETSGGIIPPLAHPPPTAVAQEPEQVEVVDETPEPDAPITPTVYMFTTCGGTPHTIETPPHPWGPRQQFQHFKTYEQSPPATIADTPDVPYEDQDLSLSKRALEAEFMVVADISNTTAARAGHNLLPEMGELSPTVRELEALDDTVVTRADQNKKRKRPGKAKQTDEDENEDSDEDDEEEAETKVNKRPAARTRGKAKAKASKAGGSKAKAKASKVAGSPKGNAKAKASKVAGSPKAKAKARASRAAGSAKAKAKAKAKASKVAGSPKAKAKAKASKVAGSPKAKAKAKASKVAGSPKAKAKSSKGKAKVEGDEGKVNKSFARRYQPKKHFVVDFHQGCFQRSHSPTLGVSKPVWGLSWKNNLFTNWVFFKALLAIILISFYHPIILEKEPEGSFLEVLWESAVFSLGGARSLPTCCQRMGKTFLGRSWIDWVNCPLTWKEPMLQVHSKLLWNWESFC